MNLEGFKIVRAAVDALPPEKHSEFLAAVFRIQMALERAEENVPRLGEVPAKASSGPCCFCEKETSTNGFMCMQCRVEIGP